jgi:hypothetical protein
LQGGKEDVLLDGESIISGSTNGCHFNRMAPIITWVNPYDYRRLLLDYISRLRPLGALSDVEFDIVTLDQRLKSIALDPAR